MMIMLLTWNWGIWLRLLSQWFVQFQHHLLDQQYASESIEARNNLDVETKIAWEVLKAQLNLNKQAWVPHHRLSLLWHFFVVNDGKKPNRLTSQTMHCLLCHFVYQTCNFGSIAKKRKDMISYNQQHGTTSMKKHILTEHLVDWLRWKFVNLGLAMKEEQWEKFKKRFVVHNNTF